MPTEYKMGTNRWKADEEQIKQAREQKKDAKSELRTMYDAIMQASEEDLSSQINLTNGALLICNKGSLPSKLVVEAPITSSEESRASYRCTAVGTHIFPFGTCKELIPPPCVPAIAGTWLSFNETDTVNEEFSINMNSFLICAAGKGIIVPITSGQGVTSPLSEIYNGFENGEITTQEADMMLLIMAFGLNEKYEEYSKGFDSFKEFLESDKFQEFKNEVLKDYNYNSGYPYDGYLENVGVHRGVDLTYGNRTWDSGKREEQLIYNIVAGEVVAVRQGDVEWKDKEGKRKKDNTRREYSDIVVKTRDSNGNVLYVHYLHLKIDNAFILAAEQAYDEAVKKAAKEQGKEASVGYAKLPNNAYVSLEENPISVSPGDVLGNLSDVGYVTGPHLHIEMGTKMQAQKQELNPNDGTINPDSMADFIHHAY